jgi:hypothetical protein
MIVTQAPSQKTAGRGECWDQNGSNYVLISWLESDDDDDDDVL